MSSYSRYWPFRSRTPSSSAAPRGRLEEESDTLGVRDEATRREGVAAPSPAGPAKPAGPRASGVVTHQVAASASRAEPPRAPSTSALRDLLISVERATVEEKDEEEAAVGPKLRGGRRQEALPLLDQGRHVQIWVNMQVRAHGGDEELRLRHQ